MILDEILEILKYQSEFKSYTINEKSYTYKDLYQFVANIYNFLLEENQSRKPVIVFGHKDIYMKAAFLACSFAGITYIPVDESMPEERIKSIIEQVNPAFVIGNYEQENIRNISQEQIEKIMNKNDFQEIDEIYMKPEAIYYIIFTSGSTGVPKGVKVTYNNLDSCVKWLKNIINIKRQVILNQAAFSFDLSVADLYLSLVSESEHFVLEKNVQGDFKLLFDTLKKSNANLAVMTPSFAEMLLLDKSFGQELMPNLNKILFCGETLLPQTVKKLRNRFKNIKIINAYGPTECTFAVTSIDISEEMLVQDSLPVGKCKQDAQIYIVNEKVEIQDDGKIGEILITGKSVSNGYIRDNAGFLEFNGEHAYLTGDLGFLQNGILYYKCRKDRQIKYKGYRIEISDIEKNLYEIEFIERAVVVPKISSDNVVSRLITFVKIKEDFEKSELDVRKELLNKLPQYMCPMIRIINEFPLNQNGKCDIKKLLEEL